MWWLRSVRVKTEDELKRERLMAIIGAYCNEELMQIIVDHDKRAGIKYETWFHENPPIEAQDGQWERDI